jgi:type IV secretory pathway TraG/TraD family ATPase VirD4
MVFATVDPYNAKKFAEMMGEQEIMEGSENVSYGAHEVRDGVSITHHKKFKPLVRHCDLNELPPLKAYVKVSSINHIFPHTFSYLDLPKRVPDFEMRDGIQLHESVTVKSVVTHLI